MIEHNGKASRRDFLKTAGIAAGTAFALPCLIPAGALAMQGRMGANHRLAVALIGAGERGTDHLNNIIQRARKNELNLAAVCDVDEKRLERAAQTAGPRTAVYRDYRYILQRKDIDAVIIATPDHWHGVQFVQAAQSGKHVYCETPACSTIAEGKAMIEAAQKAKIVAQIGAQARSQPEARAMHRYLANGGIGKVTKVTCWGSLGPADENPMADEDPPSELDWDLWLGPLRWRSYNPRFSNGVFRWIMESGGGRICHQGSQIMSCAMLWMCADCAGPDTVEATGTTPMKGLWDTAVEMTVTYKFKDPDWTLTWNQPGEPIEPEKRSPEEPPIGQPEFGAVFEGDKGQTVVWGGNGGIWAQSKVRQAEEPAGTGEVYRSSGHLDDWLGAIRTGSKTIMGVEAGVAAANLCILGNLSFILGRKLKWDQKSGDIVGDPQARRMLGRPQRFPYYF